MSNSSVKACGTCMYWARNEGAVLGECRRRPPRVVNGPLVVGRYDMDYPSAFPETYDICWCAEWMEGRHLMTPGEQAIAESVADGACSDSGETSQLRGK